MLDNRPGFVDSFDVVVRVNNYKTSPAAGYRTDVFASYFGNAVRKTQLELQRDGVKLCLCKCPNARAIESKWHTARGKENGTDFRWVYAMRAAWWFCPTYVPSLSEFLSVFRMLGGHVPTSGFTALLQVLEHGPAEVYMTGFDFFTSRIHNVDKRWREGRRDDPIRHVPEVERDWVRRHEAIYPMRFDQRLRSVLR